MDQPNIDTRALFAPKKGKEATKGKNQIWVENKATLKFYFLMAVAPFLAQVIMGQLTYSKSSSVTLVFAAIVDSLVLYYMYSASRPVVSLSGAVQDAGRDLNIPGGFIENLKDLIITTSICTFMSIFHNAFWLLWLWLPIYWVYRFWTGIIAPWVFAPAPEGPPPEVAEKKRKKMERKMARAGHR